MRLDTFCSFLLVSASYIGIYVGFGAGFEQKPTVKRVNKGEN